MKASQPPSSRVGMAASAASTPTTSPWAAPIARRALLGAWRVHLQRNEAAELAGRRRSHGRIVGTRALHDLQAEVTTALGFPKGLPLYGVAVRLGTEAVVAIVATAALRAVVLWLDERLHCSRGRTLREVVDTSLLPGEGDEARLEGAPLAAIRTFVAAAVTPVRWLLPAIVFKETARAALLLGHVSLAHLDKYAHRVWKLCLYDLLKDFSMAEAVGARAVSLGSVAFAVWFALRWKAEVAQYVLWLLRAQRSRRAAGALPDGLSAAQGTVEQLVVGWSGLLSWVIAAGGVATAVHVVGLDIRPLLTVGGLSTVALGFAAQSIAQNAMSAIKLLATRPFVVGERVTLRSPAGATIVSGWVEKVGSMQTTIKDDRFQTVLLPNRSVVDMIIVNESRLGPTAVQRHYGQSRQLSFSFTLPQEPVRIAAVVADIEELLQTHPSLDTKLPQGCKVTEVKEQGVVLQVVAHAKREHAGLKWGTFVTELASAVSVVISTTAAAKGS